MLEWYPRLNRNQFMEKGSKSSYKTEWILYL